MGFYEKLSGEKRTAIYNKFSVITIEMWVIMLAGASNPLPYRSIERIFVGSCLLTSIIISGTFQVMKIHSFGN